MSFKNKTFARITDYGDLLVPMALMEKIIDQGFLVSTTYEDNREVISELREINRISVHKGEELDAVRAQMALEGK